MPFVTIDDAVQPSEDWRFGVDFVNRIPSGVTVQTVDSVTVTDTAGTDVSSTILVAASEQVDASETSASARFHSFTNGMTYKATFKVSLSDGQDREGDLIIPTKES